MGRDEFYDDIGAGFEGMGAGFDEDPPGDPGGDSVPGDDGTDRAAPDQGGQVLPGDSSDADDASPVPDDYPVDVGDAPTLAFSLGTVMDEIEKGRCFALIGWDRKYVRAAGMKDGRITMEMVYLPGSREWPDGRVERCRSLDEGPYFEVFPE